MYNKFIDVTALSDDEVDELTPERTVNTLKSAACLCIYFVLRDHSGPHRHLSQQQILNYLEEEYEIVMERKALSRCLGTIAMIDLNVYNTPRFGTWLQPAETQESALSGPDGADLFFPGLAA